MIFSDLSELKMLEKKALELQLELLKSQLKETIGLSEEEIERLLGKCV